MMRPLLFLLLLLCLFDVQVYATKESALHTGVASSSPTTGPCTLGINAERGTLRCTENGYFELVQCHNKEEDYCACVNPLTGEEAKDTRTGSGKITARCGNCHLDVSRRVATKSGLRATIDDKRIPQCNSNNGNYRRVQCQTPRKCFCVDEITGAPIRDTSGAVEMKSVEQLNCSDATKQLFLTAAADRQVGRVAASVDPSSTLPTSRDSFVLASDPLSALSSSKNDDVGGGKSNEGPSLSVLDDRPVADPVCRLPKDAGKTCKDSSRRSPAASVQWYFDMETFECLAFRYNGCNGNANRFATISECWHHCKLADFGGCAGLKRPATDDKGESIICWSNGMDTRKCPNGYRCTMLAFFGVCCHTETQELFKRNYLPTCATSSGAVVGRAALQSVNVNPSTSGGVPVVLLGKSCADLFCPDGSVCHKKEIFAHCCS